MAQRALEAEQFPKPKPLEESESSLTSDLEFVLPDDIPKDAERIPAEELED